MKLKCQCCQIEAEFKDGEEAFTAGWDAPPHFSQYISCNLCPAICIVLGKSHAKAHELWAKEGRPKEWSLTKCGDDEWFGDPRKEEQLAEDLAAFLAKMGVNNG